jgi:hypothetical protein
MNQTRTGMKFKLVSVSFMPQYSSYRALVLSNLGELPVTPTPLPCVPFFLMRSLHVHATVTCKIAQEPTMPEFPKCRESGVPFLPCGTQRPYPLILKMEGDLRVVCLDCLGVSLGLIHFLHRFQLRIHVHTVRVEF